MLDLHSTHSLSVVIYSLVLCNRSLTCLTTLNLDVFPLKKCSENTKSFFHFTFFDSLQECMNWNFSFTVANSSLAVNYVGSRFGTVCLCRVFLSAESDYIQINII